MKKVLIISYFFPPCNLTAAQRIGSWEKYLHEYGFYPIIITRNWIGDELTEKQRLRDSGHDIRIVKSERSEIYYMPYKSSWRDYFFIRSDNNIFFKLMSKSLTMAMLYLQNFTLKAIPYRNLYYQARRIIQNDPSIEHLIISGNPFEQFHFGYLLKKQFPSLKWMADYRDDWTTTELISSRGLFQRMIHNREQKSECKWMSNASLFTSVSSYYVRKIKKFIQKEGEVLYNGYNEDLLKIRHKTDLESFHITYNGSLYATQEIEVFLKAFVNLVEKYSSKIRIKVNFPGLAYDPNQEKRVKHLLMGYEDYYFISDRIPKNAVIDIQASSDVLLMVSHKNVKGIPSSKIFEYIGLRKNILLSPSDNDVLEEIVHDVGKVACSSESCFEILEDLILSKIRGVQKHFDVKSNIEKYSSKAQVEKLSELLKAM